MKKAYILIYYNNSNHTVIRVDKLKEFRKYLTDPECILYFKTLLLQIKVGQKPSSDPYLFEIEDAEFDLLVNAVRKKISVQWGTTISFNSLSLCEDSRHSPMIKIERKKENNQYQKS